jgi:hypothetical protein
MKVLYVMPRTTPPSARTGEPEMAPASRETRKATTSAISSGRSSRLMIELGRALSMNSRWACGSAADLPMERNIASTPSVRVGPGSTALTVTPVAANAQQ